MAMRKDMSFKEKAEYIIDYYKWWIILAVLALIVSVTVCVKLLTKERYDVSLVYAGAEYYTKSYEEALGALAEAAEDIDGDGEKTLKFDQLSCIAAGDPSYVMTMTLTLENMMAKGTNYLYILDEERLHAVLADCPERLCPCREWADADGYAVSLSDSALLAAHGLPTENRYLVVCKDTEGKTERYENALRLARALIEKNDKKDDSNET